MNSSKIEVFTDGSANNMKKDIGGVGVYFQDKKYHKYNISKSFSDDATNNGMEFKAAILAIETVIKIFENKKIVWNLTIYTDSMLLHDTINKYAPDWIKLGWNKKTKGEIKNLELVKKLYVLAKCYNIKFIHCRAHQKEPTDKKSEEWRLWYGNSMADKFALEARKKKL